VSQGPAQRKLILYMSQSLDGFAARRDGTMDWLGRSLPYDRQRQRAVEDCSAGRACSYSAPGPPRTWPAHGRPHRARPATT
jgi:hypothetical protein